MTSGHRRALAVLAAASVSDVALGLWFGAADHVGPWSGMYFAVTTATTVGYGDITPRGWGPHLLAVAIMVTVVPLFAATFSLFTAGLTAAHVDDAEKRIKAHVERRLDWHLARSGPPPGVPRE